MPKDPSERDDDTDGAESDDLFDADLGSLMAGHLLDDEPPATTQPAAGPPPAPEGSTSNGVPATPPGSPAEPPPPAARPDANPALAPDDLVAERERTRDATSRDLAFDAAPGGPMADADEVPPAVLSDGRAGGGPTGGPDGAVTEDGESFEAALARAVAEDDAAEAAASNGHHRSDASAATGSDRPAVDGAAPDAEPGTGPDRVPDAVVRAAGASPASRPTVDAERPPPLTDPDPTTAPDPTAPPPTHQLPYVAAPRRDTDEMPVVAVAGDVDEDSLLGRSARRAEPATDVGAGDHQESTLAEPPSEGKSRVRSAVEWVAAIVIALVTAFLVKTFVLQAFVIPSASMNPTLVDGDRVLVSKLDIGEIERGDVIVFDNPARLPGEPAQLIKRVIGLEGDVLEARDGGVVVNGQLLDEPYLSDEVLTRELEQTTVPDDHVFVMGDNRPNSRDSRFIGAVDNDDIVGEAFLIIWPPARISTL